MSELEKELDRWKRIALYLADCHAATAEQELSRKSLGKAKQQRYLDICKKSAALIRGDGYLENGYRYNSADSVLSRLDKVSHE